MIVVVQTADEPEAPPVVPGPYLPVRNRLQLTWHAPWLDRVWDLTDPESPVYKVYEAVRPGRTDAIHLLDTAALLDGALWQRYRVPEGEQTHVVAVETVDTAAFDLAHGEFQDSLTEDYEGFLRWTKPDGSWREIPARYRSGADQNGLEGDPFIECRAMYPITWLTADPFWRGPDVVAEFAYDTGGDSPPGSTPGGPDFVFAPSNVLGQSVVRNPGDKPTYPVYRITGPFTAFEVGVGDALVKMTLTKTAGQWVEIDTRPGVGTILDDAGVERNDNVTDVEMAPILPGEVTVTTLVTGAGAGTSARVSFSPKYRRGY